MNARPNIVLVHGAWADGSSWSGVIERLQMAGYHVTAPQFPMSSTTNLSLVGLKDLGVSGQKDRQDGLGPPGMTESNREQQRVQQPSYQTRTAPPAHHERLLLAGISGPLWPCGVSPLRAAGLSARRLMARIAARSSPVVPPQIPCCMVARA